MVQSSLPFPQKPSIKYCVRPTKYNLHRLIHKISLRSNFMNTNNSWKLKSLRRSINFLSFLKFITFNFTHVPPNSLTIQHLIQLNVHVVLHNPLAFGDVLSTCLGPYRPSSGRSFTNEYIHNKWCQRCLYMKQNTCFLTAYVHNTRKCCPKCAHMESSYMHNTYSHLKIIYLTLRRLMSHIYGAPILDVSRSHKTTQHSR